MNYFNIDDFIEQYLINDKIKVLDALKSLSYTDKKKYFNNKAFINHSLLVNFEKYGPKGINMDKEPTRAMIFGSLVDCLLFTPYEFEDSFYISEDNKTLTDKQLEIFDLFYKYDTSWPLYLRDINKNDTKDIMIQVCRNNNIYNSFKDSTLISKLIDLIPLFIEYHDSRNKNIITQDEYTKAINIKNQLLNNILTKKLFSDKFKRFYQVNINNRLKKVKTLFDMILVDEVNKKIIPIDLKCTQGYENEFLENSFYKFKYYRQAEMYMDALKYFISICDDGKEWTVDDFKFLVISAQSNIPLIYNFPIKYNEDNKLIISKSGASVDKYETILERIQWHISNNEYIYDKNILEDIYANDKNNNITYLNIL